MDRKRQVACAAVAAVIITLLIALALNYLALQSANRVLDHYQMQQKEIARAIATDYLPDMQAARLAWIQAHQAEYQALNNEGIVVEADYVETPYYSAVLDPADPYYITLGPAGDVEAGQVKIGLGQYYGSNYTRASGWTVTYQINRSTHHISGLTASLVQTIAYQHYVAGVVPDLGGRLGVAEGVVAGDSPVTLDTSYLPESGQWLDVTEHKYRLKNTDLTPYLLIKTYVSGTTEEVTGVEISAPYYTSRSPIFH